MQLCDMLVFYEGAVSRDFVMLLFYEMKEWKQCYVTLMLLFYEGVGAVSRDYNCHLSKEICFLLCLNI